MSAQRDENRGERRIGPSVRQRAAMPCAARTRPWSPVAAGSPTTSDAAGQAHAAFVRAGRRACRHPQGGRRACARDAGRHRRDHRPRPRGRQISATSRRSPPSTVATASRCFSARMPVLAAERVRYVGEAVAVVVAATADQARDAAEAVEVELDPLPAAADVERAMAPDAPADLAGRAGQYRARLGGRRRSRGRCRVRACRACRAGAADRHPSCAERDGAARRHRELRRGERSATR